MSVVVVEPRLKDHKIIFSDAIDEPVFLVDASRPHVAGPVFQSLGLPSTRARITQRIVDEEIDAFK